MSDTFLVGIPCCNEPRSVLAETLGAILASTRLPSRILVVDNGDAELPKCKISGEFPIDEITEYRSPVEAPRIDVVRPERNLGCAGSWNLLHRLAGPSPIVLLNADCAVTPDTFERMMASPSPVVLAYGFGCFRIAEEVTRSVGEFDEAFYPVYLEDADYRRRLRLAGIVAEEWPTTAEAIVRTGRERAPTGIEHGKHDPDGYQGWRGDKLAWFHACVAQNRARYLAKWGGEPNAEAYATPFDARPAAGDRPAPATIETSSSGFRTIPAYEVGGSAPQPLGMPMCQNRFAVPTWSYAMERHPPARIVEIGTYNGGFTIALGVHAHRIGARVITYDVSRAPDERYADLARFLKIDFRNKSVWDAEREIAGLIALPGVSYVLCDGGDKRREIATFARYCKPGDVIGAHDYHVAGQDAWWGWSEIRAEDGAAVAAAHDLEPWLQDHFDTAAWLVYRKRSDPRTPAR